MRLHYQSHNDLKKKIKTESDPRLLSTVNWNCFRVQTWSILTMFFDKLWLILLASLKDMVIRNNSFLFGSSVKVRAPSHSWRKQKQTKIKKIDRLWSIRSIVHVRPNQTLKQTSLYWPAKEFFLPILLKDALNSSRIFSRFCWRHKTKYIINSKTRTE